MKTAKLDLIVSLYINAKRKKLSEIIDSLSAAELRQLAQYMFDLDYDLADFLQCTLNEHNIGDSL